MNAKNNQVKPVWSDDFYKLYPQALIFVVTVEVLGLASPDLHMLIRLPVLNGFFLLWTLFLLAAPQCRQLPERLYEYFKKNSRWWRWICLWSVGAVLLVSGLDTFESLLIGYGLASLLFFRRASINASLFALSLGLLIITSSADRPILAGLSALAVFYLLFFAFLSAVRDVFLAS